VHLVGFILRNNVEIFYGVAEDESLLGYYAMLTGKQLLLFQKTVVHLSGG
jgi:hypothetical protein